jgi:predicted phosphate transport protein (TIGR00153 family)
MGLFSRFFPKESNFFTLFGELADKAIICSQKFEELSRNPVANLHIVNEIELLESEADQIVHNGLVKLHETFITPFERLSIYQLFLKLDQISDLIHASAQRVKLMDVKAFDGPTKDLIWTMVGTVKLVKTLVLSLEKLKSPEEIQKICIEINKFENKADDEMRIALAALLKNTDDFKTFYVHKELIELIEEVTDSVEDITHLVEAIILDHA